MNLGHILPGFYPSVEPCYQQDRELSDQTPSTSIDGRNPSSSLSGRSAKPAPLLNCSSYRANVQNTIQPE
jgi:hypothetical protein